MAKTTEELNIKITGDSKRAKTALDKTKKAIGGVGDKAKKQSSLLKNFKQNWIGITAATAGLVIVTKKLVSAYAVQEAAQRTLSAAMKQAGTFTAAAFQHNLDYASSLQKMTTFGDEAIIGVQKMLTNFGVEGEMMDKLTEQTLNLAAAKGMDLKAAADLVAKSVGSSTNALTRYGIKVEGAAGSTERMEDAVNNISKLFGGAAVAEADTFAGSVTQLKNVFGDLMETIGGIIAKFLKPLIKIMKAVVLVLDGMPETAKLAGIALVAAFTVAMIAAQLFGVTLSIATAGISLLVAAVVAGAILMVENWDAVKFAFEVAWSAIKIGLLEAGAFILEYVPIMFAPWFYQIELIIAAINLFREEKLKNLTQMTADVQTAAEAQLTIEKDNLIKLIAAHKAAAAKKKKALEGTTGVVEGELAIQAQAYVDNIKAIKTMFDDLTTFIDTASETLITSTVAGIETMESSSKTVFASIVKSFASLLSGQLMLRAAYQLKVAIGKVIALDPSAVFNFAAAAAYTGAAGIIKALGGSAASEIMSAAGGADFVATKPQLMMVGDAPVPEHVRVTPEGQGGSEINISIGNLTVVSNDVDDMTDKIFEAAELSGARLLKRGAFA